MYEATCLRHSPRQAGYSPRTQISAWRAQGLLKLWKTQSLSDLNWANWAEEPELSLDRTGPRSLLKSLLKKSRLRLLKHRTKLSTKVKFVQELPTGKTSMSLCVWELDFYLHLWCATQILNKRWLNACYLVWYLVLPNVIKALDYSCKKTNFDYYLYRPVW